MPWPLRAARAGDTTAAGRIRAVADALTLASAQLAVAREYGFASRTRLRDETTARTASLARQAEAFCEASIRDGMGRAARMLTATPELARYSFATAVILGDAGRVRTELGRDPGLRTRVYVWTRAKGATGRPCRMLDHMGKPKRQSSSRAKKRQPDRQHQAPAERPVRIRGWS